MTATAADTAERATGQNEPMLTVDEVAALLKVDAKTVYKEIKRGLLVAHRVGTLLRVAPAAYDAYLKLIQVIPDTATEPAS